MPVYRAALALACCEAGDEPGGAARVAPSGGRRLQGIPRDSVWVLAMAFLCETTARLEDAALAAVVYGLLLPFAGRNVVSPDAIYAGPVSRYLGVAAAARHRLGRRRIGTCQRPGSRRSWTARARCSCERASTTRAR